MLHIGRKVKLLLIAGIFCVGEPCKSYSSDIYGQLIDGEWVNRTVQQICMNYTLASSEEEPANDSTAVIANSILLAGVTVGLLVDAAPCIRRIAHYGWEATCAGASKVYRKVWRDTTLNIEEYLTSSAINPFYQRLLIDLDQTLWDPADQMGTVNKKGWKKQPIYVDNEEGCRYESLFYAIEMIPVSEKSDFSEKISASNSLTVTNKSKGEKVKTFLEHFKNSNYLDGEVESKLTSLFNSLLKAFHNQPPQTKKTRKLLVVRMGELPIKESITTVQPPAQEQTGGAEESEDSTEEINPEGEGTSSATQKVENYTYLNFYFRAQENSLFVNVIDKSFLSQVSDKTLQQYLHSSYLSPVREKV